LVSILAGYESLSAGSHHLRADLALARAWGREQFADHCGISRTLAALGPEEVLWLRRAVTSIYHRMGLPNIKSCSDKMKLESTVGVGTRLEIIIYVD
jgi:hypothetical protein